MGHSVIFITIILKQMTSKITGAAFLYIMQDHFFLIREQENPSNQGMYLFRKYLSKTKGMCVSCRIFQNYYQIIFKRCVSNLFDGKS